LSVRNRNEKLKFSPNSIGMKCMQQWTSDLYLPKIFPFFGQQLFKIALSSSSFKLDSNKAHNKATTVDVSFIIGHRGRGRTDLLLTTIDSLAAQEGCNIECIIVEQDNTPIVQNMLPKWVRYVFTPLPQPDMHYSRSWAFNVGADHAKGQCLIFHDNDLLVPTCYAGDTLALFKRGYDFINLKRFIFYLSKEASRKFLEHKNLVPSLKIESIMQNAQGGGSIGASKKAFKRIGGFDQRFVGWGGEDNEFWERALTQNVWSYGYLPLVHLWHEAQTEKIDFESSNTKALYNELSEQSAKDRITVLKQQANERKISDISLLLNNIQDVSK